MLMIGGTSAAAGYLVHFSWTRAKQEPGQLRWVLIATEDIANGEQITSSMVHGGLKRMDPDTPLPFSAKSVAGEFAYAHIRVGESFTRANSGPARWEASATTDDGTASVQSSIGGAEGGLRVAVAVDPEFAVGLHPGMLLMFSREVDKKTELVGRRRCATPPKSTLKSKGKGQAAAPPPQPGSGYILIYKGTELIGDKKVATLVVELPAGEIANAVKLSNFTWGVIAVSSGTAAAQVCSH